MKSPRTELTIFIALLLLALAGYWWMQSVATRPPAEKKKTESISTPPTAKP